MERVAIFAEDEILTSKLLPYEFHIGVSENKDMDMHSVEKHHIRKVLDYTRGNKTEAARLLGIGLTTIYRKIEEYNMNDFY